MTFQAEVARQNLGDQRDVLTLGMNNTVRALSLAADREAPGNGAPSVGHEATERREEGAKIVGPVACGAMDPRHVESLIRMRDDVPEAGGSLQAGDEVRVEVARVGQPAERVGIGAGCAESQVQARRHREIDDDLHGLPEMQDDGVGSVRGGRERGGVSGKALGHASEVAVDRGGLLGEDLAVQRPQRFRSVSTAS